MPEMNLTFVIFLTIYLMMWIWTVLALVDETWPERYPLFWEKYEEIDDPLSPFVLTLLTPFY